MPKAMFVDDSTGFQVFLEIQVNYSYATITRGVLRELKLDKSAQNAEFFNDFDGSPLTTFSNLRDGDTVLVRIPKPSDPYKGLSCTEKRDVIRGKPFTGVEITLHPDNIHALLEALRTTQTKMLPTTYSASASLDLINQNWGVDIAFFPPPPPLYPDARTFRPAGDAATWDLRLLAALAILSEFTPGQGEYMGTQVNSAVELRNVDGRVKNKNWVLTEVDVRRVIKKLLKELKDHPDVEEELARKRKAEYDARRKSNMQARNAADADLPANDGDMARVEKKLKKTKLPETIEESSSEDEMLGRPKRMGTSR